MSLGPLGHHQAAHLSLHQLCVQCGGHARPGATVLTAQPWTAFPWGNQSLKMRRRRMKHFARPLYCHTPIFRRVHKDPRSGLPYSQFAGEETDAQRGRGTFPTSPSSKGPFARPRAQADSRGIKLESGQSHHVPAPLGVPSRVLGLPCAGPPMQLRLHGGAQGKH